jgi:hypothetical protein
LKIDYARTCTIPISSIVADSATATGLKWAAPATGALTLIKRSAFSAVANTGTTFDSVFSATYTNYLVMVEGWFGSSSANDDPQIQFLYSGNTETAGYYGGSWGVVYNSSTLRTVLTNNASQITVWDSIGGSNNNSTQLNFYVTDVGGSSQVASIWGGGQNQYQIEQFSLGYIAGTSRAYTGLLFKASAGNVTGTVSIYGLANA